VFSSEFVEVTDNFKIRICHKDLMVIAMRNLKLFFIPAVLALIFVVFALTRTGFITFPGTGLGAEERNNIINSAITIGDSGYTLSCFDVSKTQYHIIMTGSVSQNLPAMKAMPVVTYGEKSRSGSIKPDGESYSHQFDDFELEYVYKNPSKKATWVSVAFTYEDRTGNPATFETPKIKIMEPR